jgi:hypothetical protein
MSEFEFFTILALITYGIGLLVFMIRTDRAISDINTLKRTKEDE